MLTIPKYIASILTSLSDSTLMYANCLLISVFEYMIGISYLTCLKLNSSSFSKPAPLAAFCISVDQILMPKP